MAYDEAKKAASSASHHCVTEAQKAHYALKYTKEKVEWNYDKMDAGDKKIFDANIAKVTKAYQYNDGLIKAKVNYYTMTNQEKFVFDKMQLAYKKDVDYFNQRFDESVRK